MNDLFKLFRIQQFVLYGLDCYNIPGMVKGELETVIVDGYMDSRKEIRKLLAVPYGKKSVGGKGLTKQRFVTPTGLLFTYEYGERYGVKIGKLIVNKRQQKLTAAELEAYLEAYQVTLKPAAPVSAPEPVAVPEPLSLAQILDLEPVLEELDFDREG